jgi:hypothetical protein
VGFDPRQYPIGEYQYFTPNHYTNILLPAAVKMPKPRPEAYGNLDHFFDDVTWWDDIWWLMRPY